MTTDEQIAELNKKIDDLNDEYYSNNFTSHQDFNKRSYFNSALKVPVYTTKPSVCEIGEICSNGGKLWHCSAANTWTAQT
jgi:hypothetical protein